MVGQASSKEIAKQPVKKDDKNWPSAVPWAARTCRRTSTVEQPSAAARGSWARGGGILRRAEVSGHPGAEHGRGSTSCAKGEQLRICRKTLTTPRGSSTRAAGVGRVACRVAGRRGATHDSVHHSGAARGDDGVGRKRAELGGTHSGSTTTTTKVHGELSTPAQTVTLFLKS